MEYERLHLLRIDNPVEGQVLPRGEAELFSQAGWYIERHPHRIGRLRGHPDDVQAVKYHTDPAPHTSSPANQRASHRGNHRSNHRGNCRGHQRGHQRAPG